MPQERQNNVSVMTLPAKDGQVRTAVVGTPCFGVTLTRACWEDDARCEAALSLVNSLLNGETAMKLTTSAGGRLGESIAQMLGAATLRDVIAFPKVQNASELMTDCPAEVPQQALDDLGISINKQEK